VRKVPSPFGVVLETPAGDKIVAKRGDPSVTITGRPGEITLYLSGRRDAAEVTVSGDAAAIDALRGSSLGL
jgi:hypothetical protein